MRNKSIFTNAASVLMTFAILIVSTMDVSSKIWCRYYCSNNQEGVSVNEPIVKSSKYQECFESDGRALCGNRGFERVEDVTQSRRDEKANEKDKLQKQAATATAEAERRSIICNSSSKLAYVSSDDSGLQFFNRDLSYPLFVAPLPTKKEKMRLVSPAKNKQGDIISQYRCVANSLYNELKAKDEAMNSNASG
jgi:hypothetical protein